MTPFALGLFAAAPPADLEPSGLAYAEQFIAPDEERRLIALVASLPLDYAAYKQYTAKRRVLSFGHCYDDDANVLIRAPEIPQDFEFLRERVAARRGISRIRPAARRARSR